MTRNPFRVGEVVRSKANSNLLYIVIKVHPKVFYDPTYDVKIIAAKNDKRWILEVSDTVYFECTHKLFTRMPKTYHQFN